MTAAPQLPTIPSYYPWRLSVTKLGLSAAGRDHVECSRLGIGGISTISRFHFLYYKTEDPFQQGTVLQYHLVILAGRGSYFRPSSRVLKSDTRWYCMIVVLAGTERPIG